MDTLSVSIQNSFVQHEHTVSEFNGHSRPQQFQHVREELQRLNMLFGEPNM